MEYEMKSTTETIVQIKSRLSGVRDKDFDVIVESIVWERLEELDPKVTSELRTIIQEYQER